MTNCLCTAEEAKQPMKSNGCPIHHDGPYKCDRCESLKDSGRNCKNYIPRKAFNPRESNFWPVCICGHVAEEHN